MRIQTIADVRKGTGKTPKQFLMDFAATKADEPGVKVLKRCDETENGLFTRMCLETEEGNDHILYSLFWTDSDLAVVVIAGTTKALWSTYASTFERMGHFELIDMKRFEK